MNNKINKKSSCTIIITCILLISLLLNVFQSMVNYNHKGEVGRDIYNSVEEIRTRNESILLILNGCVNSNKITEEEILNLYKNYSLINIAELNLWEYYLNNSQKRLTKIRSGKDLLSSDQNEVFASIEELIYSTLLNHIAEASREIELDEKLSLDISMMREISNDLNNYFIEFNENNLNGLDGKDKAKKIIKKKYWIDILEGIEDINNKYIDYIFKS